jgi:hypothetical protein
MVPITCQWARYLEPKKEAFQISGGDVGSGNAPYRNQTMGDRESFSAALASKLYRTNDPIRGLETGIMLRWDSPDAF